MPRSWNGANIGWLDLGDGTPPNGIQYLNNSAADFGVNHDGAGNLSRAFAELIGWMQAQQRTLHRDLVAAIRAMPGFAALDVKYSGAYAPPFKRLKVKVKREIIRMDHPTIAPAHGRAPSVDPATLQRWLAQGSMT